MVLLFIFELDNYCTNITNTSCKSMHHASIGNKICAYMPIWNVNLRLVKIKKIIIITFFKL